MAFAKACAADELWEGDMVEVDVNDHVVVLVWPTGGEIHAYQGICPHQDIPLA
ncbi:MAG: 2Fe-2S ferredoxin, partial [Oxalobacteraceae bacterium]|nr:2Fe-2S ferredoxin [Oxalobacteraceae bacterium]